MDADTGIARGDGERTTPVPSDGYGEESGSRSRVLPLNSRRLTAALLRKIAHAMTLPTAVPAEQLRQLIDGKLIAMGKEPMNVQVVVTGAAGTPALQDEGGVFVETTDDGVEDGEHSPEDRAALEEDAESLEELQSRLETVMREKAEAESALEERSQRVATLEASETASAARIRDLIGELESEKERARTMWRLNCDQIARYDTELVERESEVTALRTQLEAEKKRTVSREVEVPPTPTAVERELFEHGPTPGHSVSRGVASPSTSRGVAPSSTERRGRAPPVDPFTGENPELRLDDWLPNLERAAKWNNWNEDELLLQFAGHLRGRALLEWNLLDQGEKSSYATATESLRGQLDPGGRALAAQDFRHSNQREHEPVGDFIRRLERTYQLAYGRDKMTTETRATLLHSQLQEGLQYRILQTPTVSGAQTYRELCLAAKNEEKRQAELQKRERYRREASTLSTSRPPGRSQAYPPYRATANLGTLPTVAATTVTPARQASGTLTDNRRGPRCYTCGSADHFARDCPQVKGES